jgi:hypothetical protein
MHRSHIADCSGDRIQEKEEGRAPPLLDPISSRLARGFLFAQYVAFTAYCLDETLGVAVFQF